MPDRVIPAHGEHDDYGIKIGRVKKRVESIKRLSNLRDAVNAIRSLKGADHE